MFMRSKVTIAGQLLWTPAMTAARVWMVWRKTLLNWE